MEEEKDEIELTASEFQKWRHTAEPGIWGPLTFSTKTWDVFVGSPGFGEGTPLTLSENEKISNKKSNIGSEDSDKESIGGGIGLQKSKTRAKKKRFKGGLR